MKIIGPIPITAGMIVASNVLEDDQPAWVDTTAYTVGDLVMYEHKIYESLVDSTGKIPPDHINTVPPLWLDLGSNNLWKMFDAKVGSRTVRESPIIITVAPGMADALPLLDLRATSVDIVMTDPTEGIVYTKTIELISTLGIIDAYTYYFNPIVVSDTAITLDLPPYSNASIEITINNSDADAEVGTVAFGMQKDLGGTQYSPTIGIQDFSKKERDIFGNYSILKRSYAKELSVEMFLPNTSVDSVAQILTKYRATPAIYIGAEGFSSMALYAFYRSFSITVAYVNDSTCNLELEGLS